MRYIIASRIIALLATLSLLSSPAAAQGAPARADANTWKVGFEGGVIMFRTPTQDATVVPSLGAHFDIMANRTGLLVGVDEGFGADEKSGLILFNDIRRYQVVLMAHPFNKRLEPYFGLGGGINQVVRPRVSGIVVDPTMRSDLLTAARDGSTAAFGTALFGIQGRWGRLNIFAQYQIGSAPPEDKLLRGVIHTLHGGIRINLGSTKEEISARQP